MPTVTDTSTLALLLLGAAGHGKQLLPNAAGVMVAGLLMEASWATHALQHVLPFVVTLALPGRVHPRASIALALAIALVSVGLNPWAVYPNTSTWVFALHAAVVVGAALVFFYQ